MLTKTMDFPEEMEHSWYNVVKIASFHVKSAVGVLFGADILPIDCPVLQNLNCRGSANKGCLNPEEPQCRGLTFFLRVLHAY